MYEAYFFLVNLLKPYPLAMLCLAGGLIYLWRSKQASRRLWLVTIPFALLLLVSLPAVSYLAEGSLEWQYPPRATRPESPGVIVVLAGYCRPPTAASPAEPGEDTIYRCLHAADLYAQGPPCPVLVSGGKVDTSTPGPPCAEVMRDFLVRLGVRADDVLLEDESRTTYENAVGCRRILQERHVDRILLVTDAVHMFRAERCFRRQGLQVTPAPCNSHTAAFTWSVSRFLPNVSAVEGCEEAAHEWIGSLWYWLRGRI